MDYFALHYIDCLVSTMLSVLGNLYFYQSYKNEHLSWGLMRPRTSNILAPHLEISGHFCLEQKIVVCCVHVVKIPKPIYVRSNKNIRIIGSSMFE